MESLGELWIILLWVAALAAFLYLLLILPGVRRHQDLKAFRSVLYAHRGLHDNASEAPENSMKAFQKAVDAGFGIELDVHLTKDRVPVVFHDDSLKRVCGKDGRVEEYSYDQLQQFTLFRSGERIPMLEEVLKTVAGKVPLIIEYKTETTNVSVCEVSERLLREYQGLYCIESFNPMALLWYRKHCPKIMRGQLSDTFYSSGERKGILYFVLENLLLNFLTRPDFIAYNHKHPAKLSRRLCRYLYRNTAVAWTIQSDAQLLEAGKHFDLFIFDSFIPGLGSQSE